MWKWPEQYTGRGVEYGRNSDLILRSTSDLKVSFEAVIMSHIWLLYNYSGFSSTTILGIVKESVRYYEAVWLDFVAQSFHLIISET